MIIVLGGLLFAAHCRLAWTILCPVLMVYSVRINYLTRHSDVNIVCRQPDSLPLRGAATRWNLNQCHVGILVPLYIYNSYSTVALYKYVYFCYCFFHVYTLYHSCVMQCTC